VAPVAAVVLADADLIVAVQMILERGDDYAENIAGRLELTVMEVRRAMTLLGHPELMRPRVFARAA
jgi:transcription initiation factor IIE alpha subunit